MAVFLPDSGLHTRKFGSQGGYTAFSFYTLFEGTSQDGDDPHLQGSLTYPNGDGPRLRGKSPRQDGSLSHLNRDVSHLGGNVAHRDRSFALALAPVRR